MHTWIADRGDGHFNVEDSGVDGDGDGSFVSIDTPSQPRPFSMPYHAFSHSTYDTLSNAPCNTLCDSACDAGFEEEGGFGFFLPSSTRGGFDIGAVTQQVTNTLSTHPSYRHILSSQPTLCHTTDNSPPYALFSTLPATHLLIKHSLTHNLTDEYLAFLFVTPLWCPLNVTTLT